MINRLQALCKDISRTVILFILVSSPFPLHANGETIDYELYQNFLDKFTQKDKIINDIKLNVVDYNSIHKAKDNASSLYNQLLSMFKGADLSTLKSKDEKIAFWINAYNIGAIKMIVDHYPVDSIRSRKVNWFKNPWGKDIIAVGNRKYSLGEIEHEILLKNLKEPMAHFAIVCASLSCPDIRPKVYRPELLKDQLKSQAGIFLSNKKKGIAIDRKKGVVYFSKIFKFDAKTFPNGAKDALLLILPFMEKERGKYLASGKYRVEYFDYDWSVNDLHRAM